MQQIIYFFQKFKYFLFFLFLECIALTLTFNNLNFHKSKFVNSANSVTGIFYTTLSNSKEYLSLKSKNQSLQEENTQLKNDLERNKLFFSTDISVLDTVKYHQKYTYTEAKIINNNYSKPHNFLTINRGVNEGIVKEMAVINRKGIIGITENLRDKIMQEIFNQDVSVNVHFLPLPTLTAYKNSGYNINDYPETWDKYQNEISLPVYFDLTDEQVQTVIKAVVSSVEKHI